MNRRSLFLSLAAPFAARAADFPRPAPKLIFKAGNQTIDLANYRGKVVVAEFLSTQCPACQDCARLINRLNPEYAPKGVQFLGIAINPGADWLAQDFAKKLDLNFPVGAVGEDVGRAFLQVSVMNPFMVPHVAFIDRQGIIQAQRGGEEQGFYAAKESIIRQEIAKLLAPPVKTTAAPKKK